MEIEVKGFFWNEEGRFIDCLYCWVFVLKVVIVSLRRVDGEFFMLFNLNLEFCLFIVLRFVFKV